VLKTVGLSKSAIFMPFVDESLHMLFYTRSFSLSLSSVG